MKLFLSLSCIFAPSPFFFAPCLTIFFSVSRSVSIAYWNCLKINLGYSEDRNPVTSFPLFLGVQSAPDVGATSYETPQLYVTFIRQRSVERKLNVKSDHSDFVGVQFTFSFQSRLALASTTRRYESWGLTNRVLPRFVERNSKSRGRKEGRKKRTRWCGYFLFFQWLASCRSLLDELERRKEKKRKKEGGKG